MFLNAFGNICSMKILVVSRHFAFRGPLAAAFLKSFSSTLEVVGYAWNELRPWPDMTRQMLWESYLEDLIIVVADQTELTVQTWDAVVMLDQPELMSEDLLNFNKVFFIEMPTLSGSALTEARKLRDEIKNECFILLRDKLLLKPGS